MVVQWPRYNWLWFYRSQKLFFCLSLYQSFILFIPKEKLVYIPINRDVGPVVINVINYICCKSNKILQTWKSWLMEMVVQWSRYNWLQSTALWMQSFVTLFTVEEYRHILYIMCWVWECAILSYIMHLSERACCKFLQEYYV